MRARSAFRIGSKREQSTPVGDLLVSFVNFRCEESIPYFVMVEVPGELPSREPVLMQFMLSKASIHMRSAAEGSECLNLANLRRLQRLSGRCANPADAWIAELFVSDHIEIAQGHFRT